MTPTTSPRAGRCAGLWKGLASSRTGGHKRARVLGWGVRLGSQEGHKWWGAAQREVERRTGILLLWRRTGISGRGNSVSAEAGRQEACVRRWDGRPGDMAASEFS